MKNTNLMMRVVGGTYQLMAAEAAIVRFAPMPSARRRDWVARFCMVELKKRCKCIAGKQTVVKIRRSSCKQAAYLSMGVCVPR